MTRFVALCCMLLLIAVPVFADYQDIPESSPFQTSPVPPVVIPTASELPLVITMDEMSTPDVPEAPPTKEEAVLKFNISGNKLISNKQILDQISTKIGDRASEVRLQKDIQLITDMGYFQDVSVAQVQTAEGVIVSFKLEENPLVQNLEFSGNTVFSRADLLKLVATKENQILNFNSVREDMKVIENLYHEKGFSLMRVVNIATPASTENNSVVFTIVEGVIEGIRLEGNNNTRDRVILRELKVKKGDIYNQEAIMSDGRKIFNLNFFSNVFPKFEPGTKPDAVVVVWNIEEKKTSSVNLGGSFGSAQGFSLFADLNLDNYNGNAELIALKGEWGSKISSYQLKYYNPWIGDKEKTSLTTRVWNTDAAFDDNEAGAAIRRGVDVVMGKELGDSWSVSGKTKLERVEPKTTSTNAYNIFMLGGSISYDTRDYWMNPTKGEYYSLNLENNNNLFGLIKDPLEITKYFVNLQNFYKVMDKQVLATRLNWGEIYGVVQDSERLYLGGGTTVRGFADNRPFAKGTRRLMGSAEYRVTLSDMFQLVAFYDFGKMSAVNYKNVNIDADFDGHWRSGHGFGFRINSPLGPIRLDFGWTDPRGSIVDSTTGQKEYNAIHFNIGQAF